jgi:hypothetical protein
MERQTMEKTQIGSVYINLPVKDLAKTRAFWEKLGFGFNEQFSDSNALCLILREGMIYAMLHQPVFFSQFTTRPLADGTTTQVLLAVQVESRARVDEIVNTALQNGATRYLPGENHGWMYYDRFADPDGHQWEISFMDESLIPKE